MSKEMRNFALVGPDGMDEGIYTGREPRQAALKAANRVGGTKEKPVEIRIRERGTKKYHVFKAWKEIVAAPKNRPKWMPERISKPFVAKVGMEHSAGAGKHGTVTPPAPVASGTVSAPIAAAPAFAAPAPKA